MQRVTTDRRYKLIRPIPAELKFHDATIVALASATASNRYKYILYKIEDEVEEEGGISF